MVAYTLPKCKHRALAGANRCEHNQISWFSHYLRFQTVPWRYSKLKYTLLSVLIAGADHQYT